MPYGENYCQLQLLFVFDFTDRIVLQGSEILSGRYALLPSVGLVADGVLLHYIVVVGLLFQNPARFQTFLEPSKGLELRFSPYVYVMLPV